MRIKAVIFDIDGTLIDSNELHVTAWDRVLREAGHEFGRDELHEHIGKGGDNYVPALLPDAREDEIERIKDAHHELFTDSYIDRVAPLPGARDLLVRVRDSGRKVVLASSASGEELEHHLRKLEAADVVEACTSKDDVEHSKPCSDVFEAALREAAVRPDEAIVVGDTPYDIEAARRAGLDTVAVRSGGFGDEELKGAIAIYDDAADLLARFDRSPLNR